MDTSLMKQSPKEPLNGSRLKEWNPLSSSCALVAVVLSVRSRLLNKANPPGLGIGTETPNVQPLPPVSESQPDASGMDS